MTEIIKQKIVSGCKNSFRTFYIAVMHYGVWLLIFLRKEQMQMKLVLAEKPSVAQSIAKVLGAAKRIWKKHERQPEQHRKSNGR